MQVCRASALIWAVAAAGPLQPVQRLRRIDATGRLRDDSRQVIAAQKLRGGFGGGLLESYTNLLARAPLRTNMVTAACLAMTSDAVAQRLCVDTEAKLDECAVYDYPRTAWMALWGSVVSGAMLQQWFVLLRYLFPLYKTSNWQLAGKVFVNQLVMSPGLNAGFFAFVILTRDPPVLRFNAEKRREYGRKIRADLPATCLRSCVYWSIVQTFNFRLLPPKYTVIATSAAYLVWTVYLSLITNIRRS